MGPKDLIKIPCAKPREGRAPIEVVEQSPRLMLLGRVREAIHTGETPLLITGLTNNGVDVIRGRRDHLDANRALPKQS